MTSRGDLTDARMYETMEAALALMAESGYSTEDAAVLLNTLHPGQGTPSDPESSASKASPRYPDLTGFITVRR